MKNNNLKIGSSYAVSIRPGNVIFFGLLERVRYKHLDITEYTLSVETESDGTYYFEKCNDVLWKYTRYEPPDIQDIISQYICDQIEINVLANDSRVILIPKKNDIRSIVIDNATVSYTFCKDSDDNSVCITICTPYMKLKVKDFYIIGLELGC